MTDKEVLESYIPIVNFIADICGSNYEVLLHDIKNPESSVIAIRNGHLSGRKIGDPMTDLAIKILNDKSYLKKEYIANYIGKSNNKKFFSSTYFIKNEGKLIGLICINNDVAPFLNLQSSLNNILKSFETEEEREDYSENIGNPVKSLANSIISKTIANLSVPPERMSIDEKVKIVQELNESGVLMLKGAVAEVAEELKISEGTVYRYLNKK